MMKVLLLMGVISIVALQVKIKDLIPMQAEELLLPAPFSSENEENKENANSTTPTQQIFLQQQQQAESEAEAGGSARWKSVVKQVDARNNLFTKQARTSFKENFGKKKNNIMNLDLDWESYRGPDGTFEFKVEFSGGNAGTQTMEWKQTSIPTKTTSISGYKAGKGADSVYVNAESFQGLALSDAADHCVLDGNGKQHAWWNCVGNIDCHSPDCIPANQGKTAKNVQLWIANVKPAQFTSDGEGDCTNNGVVVGKYVTGKTTQQCMDECDANAQCIAVSPAYDYYCRTVLKADAAYINGRNSQKQWNCLVKDGYYAEDGHDSILDILTDIKKSIKDELEDVTGTATKDCTSDTAATVEVVWKDVKKDFKYEDLTGCAAGSECETSTEAQQKLAKAANTQIGILTAEGEKLDDELESLVKQEKAQKDAKAGFETEIKDNGKLHKARMEKFKRAITSLTKINDHLMNTGEIKMPTLLEEEKNVIGNFNLGKAMLLMMDQASTAEGVKEKKLIATLKQLLASCMNHLGESKKLEKEKHDNWVKLKQSKIKECNDAITDLIGKKGDTAAKITANDNLIDGQERALQNALKTGKTERDSCVTLHKNFVAAVKDHTGEIDAIDKMKNIVKDAKLNAQTQAIRDETEETKHGVKESVVSVKQGGNTWKWDKIGSRSCDDVCRGHGHNLKCNEDKSIWPQTKATMEIAVSQSDAGFNCAKTENRNDLLTLVNEKKECYYSTVMQNYDNRCARSWPKWFRLCPCVPEGPGFTDHPGCCRNFGASLGSGLDTDGSHTGVATYEACEALCSQYSNLNAISYGHNTAAAGNTAKRCWCHGAPATGTVRADTSGDSRCAAGARSCYFA